MADEPHPGASEYMGLGIYGGDNYDGLYWVGPSHNVRLVDGLTYVQAVAVIGLADGAYERGLDDERL